MKLLAIDTATEACSAALMIDGRVEERYEVAGRSHTEKLPPMVVELLSGAGLKVAQLDGIACGIGPGSFAGVRIGVGFVKGMALAAGVPVLGITSLEMLAIPAFRAGATQVIAAIDARMSEVYVGAFVRAEDGQPLLQGEYFVGAVSALAPLPGRWTAVGTGWGTYEQELRQATGAQIDSIDGVALPRASDMLAIAAARRAQFHGADELAPLYLRNKVALTLEEQAAKRRLRAG
jgi:tRNA threonylcarbamoyladenosine biosynthesis protein TsaB